MGKRPNPSSVPITKKAKVVLSPNARRHRSRTPERHSSPTSFLPMIKTEVQDESENVPSSSSNADFSSIKVKQEIIDGQEDQAKEAPKKEKLHKANSQEVTKQTPKELETIQEPELEPESSVHKVITPFGLFKIYEPPNVDAMVFDPTQGYYADIHTGFFYDKLKTGYFFDPTTYEWLFWSKRYSTYIPCRGGDEEIKKEIQRQELESESDESITDPKKDEYEKVGSDDDDDDIIILDSDDESEKNKPSTSQEPETKSFIYQPSGLQKASTSPNTMMKDTLSKFQPDPEKTNKSSITHQQSTSNQPVKVFILNLPPYMKTKSDKLKSVIQSQGFAPKDVKVDIVITNEAIVKTTGIVFFEDKSEAVKWIHENDGMLEFETGEGSKEERVVCHLSWTDEKKHVAPKCKPVRKVQPVQNFCGDKPQKEKEKPTSSHVSPVNDSKSDQKPKEGSKNDTKIHDFEVAVIPLNQVDCTLKDPRPRDPLNLLYCFNMVHELELLKFSVPLPRRKKASEPKSTKKWTCTKCNGSNSYDQDYCHNCCKHRAVTPPIASKETLHASSKEPIGESRRTTPHTSPFVEPDRIESAQKAVDEQLPKPYEKCWICAKCKIGNNPCKKICGKCGTSKIDSDQIYESGDYFVGSDACDTLLIRGLPVNADENSIRVSLTDYAKSNFSDLRVDQIVLAGSNKYCFVYMKSLIDAMQLHKKLTSKRTIINHCKVTIGYSKVSFDELSEEELKIFNGELPTLSPIKVPLDEATPAATPPMMPKTATSGPKVIPLDVNILGMQQPSDNMLPNVGIASSSPIAPALQTLPPANLNFTAFPMIIDPMFNQGIPRPNLPIVVTPFGPMQRYPSPNPQDLRPGPSSSCFFDSSTGLLYDTTRQQYYNPTTQQWSFWSSKYMCYIPYDNHENFMKQQLKNYEKTLTRQFACQSSFMSQPQPLTLNVGFPPPNPPPDPTIPGLPPMPFVEMPKIDANLNQILFDILNVGYEENLYLSKLLGINGRLNPEERLLLEHFAERILQMKSDNRKEREKIPPMARYALESQKMLAQDVFRAVLQQNEYFKLSLKNRINQDEAIPLGEMETKINTLGQILEVPRPPLDSEPSPPGINPESPEILQPPPPAPTIPTSTKKQKSPEKKKKESKERKSSKSSRSKSPKETSRMRERSPTKQQYLREIHGDDPFSRRLQRLPKGIKITKDHLEVCKRCSYLGHNWQTCTNSHTASSSMVNKVIKLAEIYKRYHKIGQEDLEEGEISSSSSNSSDSVIELTGETSSQMKEVEILDSDNKDGRDMVDLSTELDMSFLEDELQKLANNKPVRMKHLKICTSCGKLGHLGYSCGNIKDELLTQERLEAMFKLLDEYRKEHDIKDEPEAHKLGSLLDESPTKKPTLDGTDPLTIQIHRHKYQHTVKLDKLWKDAILKAATAEPGSSTHQTRVVLFDLYKVYTSNRKDLFVKQFKKELKEASTTYALKFYKIIYPYFKENLKKEELDEEFHLSPILSRLCPVCAQIGHILYDCTFRHGPIYAQATNEDIERMKDLVRIYRKHNPYLIMEGVTDDEKSPRKFKRSTSKSASPRKKLETVKEKEDGRKRRRSNSSSSSEDPLEDKHERSPTKKISPEKSHSTNEKSTSSNSMKEVDLTHDKALFEESEIMLLKDIRKTRIASFNMQLEILKTSSRFNSENLVLCENCARVGHLDSDCFNIQIHQKSIIREMHFLLNMFLKQRRAKPNLDHLEIDDHELLSSTAPSNKLHASSESNFCEIIEDHKEDEAKKSSLCCPEGVFHESVLSSPKRRKIMITLSSKSSDSPMISPKSNENTSPFHSPTEQEPLQNIPASNEYDLLTAKIRNLIASGQMNSFQLCKNCVSFDHEEDSCAHEKVPDADEKIAQIHALVRLYISEMDEEWKPLSVNSSSEKDGSGKVESSKVLAKDFMKFTMSDEMEVIEGILAKLEEDEMTDIESLKSEEARLINIEKIEQLEPDLEEEIKDVLDNVINLVESLF